MAKDGDRIDPLSIRLRVGDREYRIGLRVMTPEGLGTVTGFDMNDYYDIGVTLDSTGKEVYTTWEYAEPATEDEEYIPTNDAEDRYTRW